MIVTLVYGKCTQLERISLWELLGAMADSIQDTWIVGRDFNVIISDEEKLESTFYNYFK